MELILPDLSIAYNLWGPYNNFNGASIWKAKAEGKQKFFAWVLVQCKVLMADKLMGRQ